MSIRDHLVDDWRHAWKWASVRLAVVAGVVAGALVDPNNALMAVQLLYSMPPEFRWFLSPVAGLLVALIPIALRLWKPKAKDNESGGDVLADPEPVPGLKGQKGGCDWSGQMAQGIGANNDA